MDENQTNWDQVVQPLTYEHNGKGHRSTETSPFALILSRHPTNLVLNTSETSTLSDSELPYTDTLRIGLFCKLRHMFLEADKRTEMYQRAFKKYFESSIYFVRKLKVSNAVFIDRTQTTFRQRKKR